MILAKDVIKENLKTGKIKITPFNLKDVNETSVDISLSDEFWIFDKQKKIVLNDKTDFKKYTKKIKAKSITLEPGAFVIAVSKEKISLPNNIAGFLSGRSRFARMGIVVHATAFLMHAGVSNRTVFEIKNLSNNTLTLKAGLKLAQVIFVKTEGEAKYKGRFKKQ